MPKNSKFQSNPLHAEVQDRFGVLPNFFRLAPEAPEITENLWGFAKFGYLDNPLPPLFKERLFVYLSRFCEVRYCIARHVGFLAGLGRPSGDRLCPPETIEQVVNLIRRELPRGEGLEPLIAHVEKLSSTLVAMPESDSPTEEAIFACATHVFLQTPQAPRCLEALRCAFDGAMFQHLLVFLSFVRTAHFWTKLHPELQLEEDISDLLTVHEALAEQVRDDPEASSCETTENLLNEVAILRHERALRETVERANEALRARERQLQLITDNAAVLIAQCDAEGRYKFVNRPYAARFGLTPEDLIGRHLSEVVGERAYVAIEPYVQEVLKGQTVEFEAELDYSGGGTHVMRCAYTPEQEESGKVVGLVAAIIDITDRKRVEQEVRESRSRLDSTLAASEIGTWEFDVVANTVRADENLAHFFGLSPEAASGATLDNYLNVIHPDDRERVAETIGQALAAGESYEADYRIAVPDAPLRSVVARGRVERDQNGQAVRLPGVVVDITAQRRAEELLRWSEDRRRLALDAAELGAWNIDPHTNTLTSDKRFRIIFQGSSEPLTYEQAFAAIHPDDRQRIRDAVAAATNPDDPLPYAEEYRVVHQDGSIRWVFGKGRANIEPSPMGVSLASFDGTVSDVTTRKQAEQERQKLIEELRDQDRRKDEFLATLAHELRNPLAPLRNGLQVLRLGGVTGEIADEARMMMDRQLTQMVHLIDDLLDLSRISRGKIELRMERVELSEIIKQSLETSGPAIEEAGHALSIDLSSSPIYVDADSTRLAQVFSNLLNNAAKYTERGGQIRLLLQREGSEAVVSVKDTGIGIPQQMLSEVFEMFTQVDKTLDRAQGGLGIGLSIVKRLIGMHGGSVEARSDGLGRGSEFLVRLPVVLSITEPNSRVDDNAAKVTSRRRILVVDDNRDSALSLAIMLRLTKNDAKTAHDGIEALELAAAYRPDLIFLDIGMPRLNGFDTAKRIRQQPWGKGIVLVALTGWGQEEDRRKSREAGFNAHLVKPIEAEALEQLLENLDTETAS